MVNGKTRCKNLSVKLQLISNSNQQVAFIALNCKWLKIQIQVWIYDDIPICRIRGTSRWQRLLEIRVPDGSYPIRTRVWNEFSISGYVIEWNLVPIEYGGYGCGCILPIPAYPRVRKNCRKITNHPKCLTHFSPYGPWMAQIQFLLVRWNGPMSHLSYFYYLIAMKVGMIYFFMWMSDIYM